MNTKALIPSQFNLFDKQFLVSRITCFLFIGLLLTYLIGSGGVGATVVCLSLISLFLVQFIYQFQLLNGLLGGIMFLLGVYFSLAVWSEFTDFEVVTQAARQLLLVGWGRCLLVISLAVLLIRSVLLQD
jgi:hypothetical protein